jgi:hypothetical protein
MALVLLPQRAILTQRVVITKGDVARPSPVLHLPDTVGAHARRRIDDFGPKATAPLQQIWWTPTGNLPAFSQFNSIAVSRGLVGDNRNWNECFIKARNASPGAAKIALQVYGTVAEIPAPRNGSITLVADDFFKLHTNNGAVTFRLPDATDDLVGAELFFEVTTSTTVNFVVTVDTTTTDRLEFDSTNFNQALATAQGSKMVVACQRANRWRVTDHSPTGWTPS